MRTLPLLLAGLATLTITPALWASRAKASDFFEGAQVALAEAAADGRTDKLAALVSRGADVNTKGVEGMTAILWALSRLSKPGVAWLLEHGANPNVIFAHDGSSTMYLAASTEDPWFLKEILEHGGDVNIRNSLNGRTPLAQAIAAGQKQNARALIAAGADMNTFDTTGLPPLIFAAANQKYDLVYDMLVAGADPQISPPKWHGKTLLSVIRRSTVPPEAPPYQWQLKVIELLKQKGLDVDHGQ